MPAGASVAVESDFTPRKLRKGAVCLMGQSLGTSLLAFGALTLVMLPMTEEFHWTRTQFSYAMAICIWCGALTGPGLGRLVDHWGVRPTVLGGTAVVGIATLAMSCIAHLWQFYLCFALAGAFDSGVFGYSKVIGATFTRNRGKAFAVVIAITTMVSSIFPQLTNILLTRMGWRGAFAGLGILILAAVVVLFFTLEEPGEPKRPSGRAEEGLPPMAVPAMEGRTAAQVRRDRIFWTFVGTAVLTGAIGAGWGQHQVAFLMGRGFSRQQLVNALSLAMFLSPLITMLGGWLVDRVQSAKIAAPFALFTAVGILGQVFVSASRGGTPLVFVSIYLGMIVMSAQIPMMQYFCSRYFGMKAFGEIYGSLTSILAVVMGFSPPLIAMLYEHTGSYNIALILMIAGDLAAALLFLTVGRYRYRVDSKPSTPATEPEMPAIAGARRRAD
jgi:nitrate/nitrite transporter NarK